MTVLIHKLPKHRSLRLPNKIIEQFCIENKNKYIYLRIYGYTHPVKVCGSNLTIPKILVSQLKNHVGRFVKMEIKEIENKIIYFLSEFRPHRIGGELDSYYLHVHKLESDKGVLKISVNNGYFYGKIFRNRIGVGHRILDALRLEPNKIYQFSVEKTCKHETNNDNLFENKENVNILDAIEEENINIEKLLPDFIIMRMGKKIKVHYKVRCKDSKKMSLKNSVLLSDDLFRLFGLFQAEGVKTNVNYFGLGNTNLYILRYFKNTTTRLFGLNKNIWRAEIKISPQLSRTVEQKYWCDKLGLSKNQTVIYYNKNSIKPYVVLKIPNNTARKIFYRLFEAIKIIVKKDEKWCGPFLSGVLSGDGCVVIDKKKKRVKRIELAFNPHKIYDEVYFYIDALKNLSIKHFYLRLYTNKSDSIKMKKTKIINRKILRKIKKVQIQNTKNLFGIGGKIIIHRKEDLEKLADHNLFYPNSINSKKFYRFLK